MVKRKELLTKLREYTAEEIAEAVSASEVTIYELNKTGMLTPRMRMRVEQFVKNGVPAPQPETAPAPAPQPAAAPETAEPETPAPAPQSAPQPEPEPQSAPAPAQPKASPASESTSFFQEPWQPKQPAPTPEPQPDPYATFSVPEAPKPAEEKHEPEAPKAAPAITEPPVFTGAPAGEAILQPGFAFPDTQQPKAQQPQRMFSRIFSFGGRIRRTEFGLSLIFYSIALSVVSALGVVIGEALGSSWDPSPVGFLVAWLLGMLLAVIFIAQSVKRSHDTGHSGWMVLIPFYGIYLLFASGTPGYNKYGPSPK